ncbi:MAG: 3'-5' exonuclease [Gemmatimonadaceae bacterium]|nr:3'-5' exonuclease [Gemmatimonadaceae bacterium]
MDSESLLTSLGARLKPAESSLTDAAVALVARGPIGSPELVAQVCQAIGVRRALAESLARAILGARPDVRQAPDGRWHLVELPQLSAPRGIAAPAVGTPPPRSAGGRYSATHDSPTLLREGAAALPISALRFAVVDVETTGGRPGHGDRITEIAIVRVHAGEIVDVFETLVNPQCAIPPMITQITRITSAMVRDKPLFESIAHDVADRLAGHIFVAHNAAFDWRFVSHEVFRGTGQALDGTTLCTVRLARKILPQLPRRNLDSVARHYAVDIPAEARHRAAGDAIATAKVLVALLRDAAARDITTWGALDAFQRTGTSHARRKKSAAPRPVRDASDGA